MPCAPSRPAWQTGIFQLVKKWLVVTGRDHYDPPLGLVATVRYQPENAVQPCLGTNET